MGQQRRIRSKHLCTYIHAYVRTFVCTLYVCVCMYIRVCVVCTCVHVCTYVCVSVLLCVYSVVNPFTGVPYCTAHTYICTFALSVVVGSGKTWPCSARCQRSWLTDPCLSLVYPFSTTASLPLANVQGTHISVFTHEGCWAKLTGHQN